MKKLLILLIIFILAILLIYFLNPFSAPNKSATVETYIVPQDFGEAIVIEDLKN